MTPARKRFLIQLALFALIWGNMELYFSHRLREDGYEKPTGWARLDPFTAHRVLGGLNKTNWEGTPSVRTNPDGLRDEVIPPECPPGEIRILCLGGSLTFGIGLDADSAWPRMLESMLRAKAPPGTTIRVINGGQPGFSAYNGAGLLEDVGPRYKPSVVVSMFGFNDQYAPIYPGPIPPSTKLSRRLSQVFSRSPTYRYIYWRIKATRDCNWVAIPWWNRSVTNVGFIEAYMQSRGGHLLVCSEARRRTPGDYDFAGPDDQAYRCLKAAYTEFGTKKATPVLIMDDVFAGSKASDDELFQQRSAVHTTTFGSYLIAYAVAEQLWKQGWIPRTSR